MVTALRGRLIKRRKPCGGPPDRSEYSSMQFRHISIMILVAASSLAICAQQTSSKPLQSGSTVRHRKVAVGDPSIPPELLQAEAALENKKYGEAEPLLKQVVEVNPKNYQAWFDLGFLYN